MVIGSDEKLETHKKINTFFMPWIEHFRSMGGTVITMPAQSGKQEIQILEYIEKLETVGGRCNVSLVTFDREIPIRETNIPLKYHGRLWQHRLEDVYVGGAKIRGNVACWFDMTGGLTNKNLDGITNCAAAWNSGSLIFITLQIQHPRGLAGNSTAQTYSSTANTIVGNTVHTARLLEQNVLRNNKQKLHRLMPTYTYKRKIQAYGVFGYIIR